MKPQVAKILEHLQRSPLTPLEALDQYGCFRLAARIDELKRQGHLIATQMVNSNGKKFAQYYLMGSWK